MSIHPTAVISPEASLAEGVEIGPFSIITGKVKIGARTKVHGHVTLGSEHGVLEIGEDNQFFPGAVIGGPPQDVTFKGEETRLLVGDRNVFREFCTVNTATAKATKETRVGSDCYLMSYTHVGHDCVIGDQVIIANDTHIGGHTLIEQGVIIGGVCAFNQFVRVGRNAFIAGGSEINKDILPFSRAQGRYAVVRATNKIGLQRKGYPREDIDAIHKAIRIIIMGSATIAEAIERIQSECRASEHIDYLLDFVRSSERGIAK